MQLQLFWVYDDNKLCIGTVWNAKMLDNFTPLKYLRQQKPAVLRTDPLSHLFTQSECRIIFFALQRYSPKEIAGQLNLSPRTVENRLGMLYQKTGTHSFLQFIEYCKAGGWDNYLPHDFLSKGIQFI